MSGMGLAALGRPRVRGAFRVALRNARRGFGKFSQHGDRFAMVLEPQDATSPLDALSMPASAPWTGGPEAVALCVPPAELSRLSEREGYASAACERLLAEAHRANQDLAPFLWGVLEAAAFDIPRFRALLFARLGYTSPHYIPHPVRIDASRFGILFLAPGREGTGAAQVAPVRIRTGTPQLMSIAEAWQRKPNQTQLAYFLTCLLGGVHGISVHDLLAGCDAVPGLHTTLQEALARTVPAEHARFLAYTGLAATTYGRAFGTPAQALERGGLATLLQACQ